MENHFSRMISHPNIYLGDIHTKLPIDLLTTTSSKILSAVRELFAELNEAPHLRLYNESQAVLFKPVQSMAEYIANDYKLRRRMHQAS